MVLMRVKSSQATTVLTTRLAMMQAMVSNQSRGGSKNMGNSFVSGKV
jgi:hypothetical protein